MPPLATARCAHSLIPPPMAVPLPLAIYDVLRPVATGVILIPASLPYRSASSLQEIHVRYPEMSIAADLTSLNLGLRPASITPAGRTAPRVSSQHEGGSAGASHANLSPVLQYSVRDVQWADVWGCSKSQPQAGKMDAQSWQRKERSLDSIVMIRVCSLFHTNLHAPHYHA